MKVGFVGTLTVYRQVDMRGVKVGQIDVIQYGDHQHPSKVHTINVINQAYCRIILEVMQETPNPLIRAILWLEAAKGELEISLLELVSVNEPLLAAEGMNSGT